MVCVRKLLPLAAFAAVLVYAAPAPAQTIIDEWQSVKAPPAPEFKAVTVDPKTTALLVLDLLKQICTNERGPRCAASLPKVKNYLDEARARGLLVVYSLFPGLTVADILPEVAPKGNEPIITGELDKFEGSAIDKILKDKGIKSVIIIGTKSNGAILYTATTAFIRGYQTILAVDAVSGTSPYIEQYVIYNFVSAPVVGGKVILTRNDMIKFAN